MLKFTFFRWSVVVSIATAAFAHSVVTALSTNTSKSTLAAHAFSVVSVKHITKAWAHLELADISIEPNVTGTTLLFRRNSLRKHAPTSLLISTYHTTVWVDRTACWLRGVVESPEQ